MKPVTIATTAFLAMFAYLAMPATAAPNTAPLPRLETGMHTAIINRIATDRDGRWAVTAADDKTARIWDLSGDMPPVVLRPPQDMGNAGKLYAVAMSPDGTRVAVGGWAGKQEEEDSIYVFDRISGQLLRRISGLPNVIHHLAWSADGRWLAASLGGKSGLRLYDAVSGEEVGRDADYSSSSYSVHFSPDSQRLVATCEDGRVRLYALDSGRLRRLLSIEPDGGRDPLDARFAPDGRTIAVGFADSTVVQVLDAITLAEVARPATTGVESGNLGSLAWSADGRHLYAAGRWAVSNKHPVRIWTVGDWSRYRDVPLTNNTVMSLAPLPRGRLLFAAGNPAWGVLDPDGHIRLRRDGSIADFRDQTAALQLSADGGRVRYGYEPRGQDARIFDLKARILLDNAPTLDSARTKAPGLRIENWENRPDPSANGRPLELKKYETSRCLAVAADGRHFVLGADWSLRLYDRDGKELWHQAVPGTVWAVNLSADGRFVVAAYGDGTIRWHRFADGREILALFPHADRKRWIAWTPEGYFDASPGAENLMGYHLNQGIDREGEFVSARQLWETFYQPGLLARRLDADGDALIATAVERRGDIRRLLAAAQPPELELLSPAKADSSGDYMLRVKVRQTGQGKGRLVVRLDGQEFDGRWPAPTLAPGGVVELPLSLAAGQRRLSVELVDGRGIASPPVSANVSVKRTDGVAPTLHVLAVGISAYRDRSLAQGVAYAAQDARAVTAALERGGGGLYRQVLTRVLADTQATREAILTAGREMATRVQPQDAFIVFLAGHGMTMDNQYHFLPWESRYTNNEALKAQAINADQLRGLLAAIPAGKVLVLLDTCASGAFTMGRGVEEKAAIDRLQRLTGRAMIAATADSKMALEGERGHGVFTFSLLDALTGKADGNRDGQVDVGELARHIDTQVPDITKRKWGYEQFPMIETRGSAFPVVKP